jgi:heme-degrading monooxygenase HmoA
MPAILIRQRVSDYAAWKRAFAEQAHDRTANGCQGAQIFRNSADPHEMVILLTWDTLVRARLFAQSDEWLESIDRGNLIDRPDIWILEETGELPGS